MSDIRLYTAAQAGGLTPLTGDIILCSEAFNGAPANSVHLALAGGATPTWKSFANDASITSPFSNQYSLSFDGSDDYLTMSPVTPTAQQGTVSAWIKTSTGSTKEVLCQTDTTSDTTYLFLSIDSGGYPRLGWVSGSSKLFKRGSTQVNDGDWHHVVFISDGSAWKIYVDGEDEGTLTTVVSGTASDGSWYGDLPAINALRIGCQERSAYGTTSHFNGNIDEVAIFNSALTSEQVASLIDSSGANPVPADISSLNPSAWWRMGDDSNDTFVDGGAVASITDSSGNGNTATQAAASSQPTFSTDVPS